MKHALTAPQLMGLSLAELRRRARKARKRPKPPEAGSAATAPTGLRRWIKPEPPIEIIE